MDELNQKPFDALIFDLGSTLIYFDGDWPQVIRCGEERMINELIFAGLDLDQAQFARDFSDALQVYYRERETEFIEYTTTYILRDLLTRMGYPGLPEVLLRRALDALYLETQSHWHVEEDAIATLERLKSMGYRLGMISNAGDDKDVQVLVDKAGVRPYFDRILTSAALGIRKPNPRIFEILLVDWQLPATRVAMIGDRLGADILGALNAGIYSIWITRRADSPANKDHMDTIIPDSTIERLDELPHLLQSLTFS